MTEAAKRTAIKLMEIEHFSLSVRNPEKTAEFWTANFDLKEAFRFEEGVGLSNGRITIVLKAGEPAPVALGHMAFRLEDMEALRAAAAMLKASGIDLEDPGHPIGLEDHVAPEMSLWFRCLDGYRWELAVPSKSKS